MQAVWGLGFGVQRLAFRLSPLTLPVSPLDLGTKGVQRS
jgi:hypothetical protein